MWRAILLPLVVGHAAAQLTGAVGPLTSYTQKAAKKVCNVIDYGGFPNNGTDVGPAFQDAWDDCQYGGLVYFPPGNYSMSTWVALKDGYGTAIQLDGVIYRDGDDGGKMIGIRGCSDLEIFSGNSKGAIQGYGYKFLESGDYGPRLLRLTEINNFSVHGIALVDSPAYYLTIDDCSNGEIYNIIMRGISTIGGTDAIDVWGSNMWIHDIEATNGDECVTVKDPSTNFLIESIYCNLSGGMSIGSLGLNTNISDIHYRNLYMNDADACFIKYNGANGTVKNILWDTVTVHSGAYILSIDSHWGSDVGAEGVEMSNLTFKNWHGYNSENARPVIRLECTPEVPCTDITLEDIHLWTSDGDYVTWQCEDSYGSGGCLNNHSAAVPVSTGGYTSVITATSIPKYTTSWMPHDLTAAFPTNSSFTIPPVPTTFYPGQRPSSALLHLTGPGGLYGSNATMAATSFVIAKSTSIAGSKVSTTVATPTSSIKVNPEETAVPGNGIKDHSGLRHAGTPHDAHFRSHLKEHLNQKHH